MIVLLFLLVLGPLLLHALSTGTALLSNYNTARKIGLPIFILPISPENALWLIVGRHVAPWLKHLPFGGESISKVGYSGWEWVQKFSIHLEYGDAFVLVTPGKNWLYTCNGETLHDIFQRERRGDFERPVEIWAMLASFGPNVTTALGEDWQRHRKITAAAFTEKTNRLVWTETISQAEQMLQYWKRVGHVRSTPNDCRNLALNVLVSVSFGRSFPFRGGEEEEAKGPLSYQGSLRLILENILFVFIIGPDRLTRTTFPANLARVGEAIVTFKKFMTEEFEEEKKALQEKRTTQENLMTNLVRAYVQDKETGGKRYGISEPEVFGNMFAFNFAGHDTTARSLNFSFYLLAAYAELQHWVYEEISHVYRGDPSPGYDSFPKLTRCMAFMYETLRLFTILVSVPRRTQDYATDLVIDGKTYTIPPQTRVLFNTNAAHTHPRHWGDDSLEFKPSRWILTAEGDGPAMDRESLRPPPRGAYMAWLDGNHVCPGKKFSQVEYAALLVTLLRDHYVEPVKEAGEDIEQARKRAKDCLADSGVNLVFQMLRPETVPLVWKRR
ncbi:Cytochrome P450 [Macrophomina phaseolina MS6]|uniref:Cytochrome P450 n=1 Tax=Macrophomina phaseolina (strain MS6) TaxID=1126212 RepID=K2SDH7_MACPH|nr:Cytochrome P450 [Macrophomina phaseolina MS6]